MLEIPVLTTDRLIPRAFIAESLGAVRGGEVQFFGAPAAIYRYPRAADA